jgi:hypothetical protein
MALKADVDIHTFDERTVGGSHISELDRECAACIKNDHSGSKAFSVSPGGTFLLIGGSIFPSGTAMPISVVSETGHLGEWSRLENRLWTASGQIVRVWNTNIERCIVNAPGELFWRQMNFTVLQSCTATAISESTDCKVLAVGVTINPKLPAPDANRFFPGEALRPVRQTCSKPQPTPHLLINPFFPTFVALGILLHF